MDSAGLWNSAMAENLKHRFEPFYEMINLAYRQQQVAWSGDKSDNSISLRCSYASTFVDDGWASVDSTICSPEYDVPRSVVGRLLKFESFIRFLGTVISFTTFVMIFDEQATPACSLAWLLFSWKQVHLGSQKTIYPQPHSYRVHCVISIKQQLPFRPAVFFSKEPWTNVLAQLYDSFLLEVKVETVRMLTQHKDLHHHRIQ